MTYHTQQRYNHHCQKLAALLTRLDAIDNVNNMQKDAISRKNSHV